MRPLYKILLQPYDIERFLFDREIPDNRKSRESILRMRLSRPLLRAAK